MGHSKIAKIQSSVGLSITLKKDYPPTIIECGGEKVELHYSLKSSANSKSIIIRANKEKVDIAIPRTLSILHAKIDALKLENDELRKQLENLKEPTLLCKEKTMNLHI